MAEIGPVEIGGAVALGLAAIRLAEEAVKAGLASLKIRRNGSPLQSQEVRELKQVNESLHKISTTLEVMRTEAKQTLTKVCENSKEIGKVKSGVNWLKWSSGAHPEEEG